MQVPDSKGVASHAVPESYVFTGGIAPPSLGACLGVVSDVPRKCLQGTDSAAKLLR